MGATAAGIRMKPPRPSRRVREARDHRAAGAAGDGRRAGARRHPRDAVDAPHERASLSPGMALRLEKAFGVSMDTLMRMQNSYDIARIRERAGEIKVAPFGGTRPVKQAASG